MNLPQGSNTIPTGTVTFLFTDIEGSTKLWEAQPQAMQAALARHDALLRDAIGAHNGYVFKTVGDAFCAAFHTASMALQAALKAQQDLQVLTLFRVRMALHTGAAESRDNDYFGQALNRVARLMATGHGGQILLSLPAEELVRDSLPRECSLRALGEHRLRDLHRPEQVYQLLHPTLSDAFPPLRSLDNPALPNNLPRQVTSFIGREKELKEITERMKASLLLTLTGSGGCGKTRLSLQVAADVLEDYPDGVWLVELAPLTDPNLVAQTVAVVLAVREEPGEAISKTLISALKDKRMLLVLDNCEHLLDAVARLVDTLLKSCPHLRILASSREVLGIPAESAYRVPSLSSPELTKTHTPASVVHFEAVRLFVERALAAKIDFTVTHQNSPTLVSICHRLDGIPLAIELAAARMRAMPIEQLEERLDNRFRLLTGGSRTALPRQQTLKALMDWSYDLLNDQEKKLLNRLSVFLGGWTLESAERVCADESLEGWEILDVLTSLVDKSLVVYETQESTGRYRLLETVRQYSKERLLETADAEGILAQHREFYTELAELAEQGLIGAEQEVWLARLEPEHDNFRAALHGAKQQGESPLRLAGALWRFWLFHGLFLEGQTWLEEALSSDYDAPPSARAKALVGLGTMLWMQGDYWRAEKLHRESLDLYRQIQDDFGIAFALNNVGSQFFNQGNYEEAEKYLRESLLVSRQLSNKWLICLCVANLGELARCRGVHSDAKPLYEEALHYARELNDRYTIAMCLSNLGVVLTRAGDLNQALSYFREGIAICHTLTTSYLMSVCLEGMAGFWQEKGEPLRAARLFGAMEAYRESRHYHLEAADLIDHNRSCASARASSDAALFEVAWSEGRGMVLEQAIAYALDEFVPVLRSDG